MGWVKKARAGGTGLPKLPLPVEWPIRVPHVRLYKPVKRRRRPREKVSFLFAFQNRRAVWFHPWVLAHFGLNFNFRGLRLELNFSS